MTSPNLLIFFFFQLNLLTPYLLCLQGDNLGENINIIENKNYISVQGGFLGWCHLVVLSKTWLRGLLKLFKICVKEFQVYTFDKSTNFFPESSTHNVGFCWSALHNLFNFVELQKGETQPDVCGYYTRKTLTFSNYEKKISYCYLISYTTSRLGNKYLQ